MINYLYIDLALQFFVFELHNTFYRFLIAETVPEKSCLLASKMTFFELR